MKVELSLEEISQLINDIQQSKAGYEHNAIKYLSPRDGYHEVPDYYKNHYKPTLDAFDERIHKLREMRDEIVESQTKIEKNIIKKSSYKELLTKRYSYTTCGVLIPILCNKLKKEYPSINNQEIRERIIKDVSIWRESTIKSNLPAWLRIKNPVPLRIKKK